MSDLPAALPHQYTVPAVVIVRNRARKRVRPSQRPSSSSPLSSPPAGGWQDAGGGRPGLQGGGGGAGGVRVEVARVDAGVERARRLLQESVHERPATARAAPAPAPARRAGPDLHHVHPVKPLLVARPNTAAVSGSVRKAKSRGKRKVKRKAKKGKKKAAKKKTTKQEKPGSARVLAASARVPRRESPRHVRVRQQFAASMGDASVRPQTAPVRRERVAQFDDVAAKTMRKLLRKHRMAVKETGRLDESEAAAAAAARMPRRASSSLSSRRAPTPPATARPRTASSYMRPPSARLKRTPDRESLEGFFGYDMSAPSHGAASTLSDGDADSVTDSVLESLPEAHESLVEYDLEYADRLHREGRLRSVLKIKWPKRKQHKESVSGDGNEAGGGQEQQQKKKEQDEPVPATGGSAEQVSEEATATVLRHQRRVAMIMHRGGSKDSRFAEELPPLDYHGRKLERVLARSIPLIQRCYLDLSMPTSATNSTLLHTAAWFRKVHIIRILLAFGAKPNHQNTRGFTPLHYLCEHAAAGRAHTYCCLMLMLAAGANVDLKNTEDTSPRDLYPAVATLTENEQELQAVRRLLNMRAIELDKPEPMKTAKVLTKNSRQSAPKRLNSRAHRRHVEKAAHVFRQLQALVESKAGELHADSANEGFRKETGKIRGWGSRDSVVEVAAEPESEEDEEDSTMQFARPRRKKKRKPEESTEEQPSQVQIFADKNSDDQSLRLREEAMSEFELSKWERQWFQRTKTSSLNQRAFTILEQSVPGDRSETMLEFLYYWSMRTPTLAFLQPLPPVLVRGLLSVSHLERQEKGDAVFEWHEMSTDFFVVMSGAVSLTSARVLHGNAEEVPVKAGAGSIFGNRMLKQSMGHGARLWAFLRRQVRQGRVTRDAHLSVGQDQEFYRRRQAMTPLERALLPWTFRGEAKLRGAVRWAMSLIRKETAVVSSSRVVLLRFDYYTYRALEYSYHKQLRDEAVEFFQTVPYSMGWDMARLRRLASSVRLQIFHRGDVIARQSRPLSAVSFIISGSVDLIREVQVTRSQSWPLAWDQWQINQTTRMLHVPVFEDLSTPNAFGQEALMGMKRQEFSVVCKSPQVTVLTLPERHYWHFTHVPQSMSRVRYNVDVIRRRAAERVQAFLINRFPKSHQVVPFENVVWDAQAVPEPEPVFRALKPGCVFANYNPIIAGLKATADPSASDFISVGKTGLVLATTGQHVSTLADPGSVDAAKSGKSAKKARRKRRQTAKHRGGGEGNLRLPRRRHRRGRSIEVSQHPQLMQLANEANGTPSDAGKKRQSKSVVVSRACASTPTSRPRSALGFPLKGVRALKREVVEWPEDEEAEEEAPVEEDAVQPLSPQLAAAASAVVAHARARRRSVYGDEATSLEAFVAAQEKAAEGHGKHEVDDMEMEVLIAPASAAEDVKLLRERGRRVSISPRMSVVAVHAAVVGKKEEDGVVAIGDDGFRSASAARAPPAHERSRRTSFLVTGHWKPDGS